MAKKPPAIALSELTIDQTPSRNAFVDIDIIDNERRLDAIETYLEEIYKSMGHIGIPQFVPVKTGDGE